MLSIESKYVKYTVQLRETWEGRRERENRQNTDRGEREGGKPTEKREKKWSTMEVEISSHFTTWVRFGLR